MEPTLGLFGPIGLPELVIILIVLVPFVIFLFLYRLLTREAVQNVARTHATGRFCSSCGAESWAEALYCVKCGQLLSRRLEDAP